MKRLDQFSAIFWLVISIIVCVESRQAHVGTFKNPGPGFLPLFGGIALGGLAILLLAMSILRKKLEVQVTNPLKGVKWRKVILVLAPLFAYTIFLSWIGYLVTTFALMFLLFTAIDRSKIWADILIALIAVSSSYVVFYKWLDIQLPKGILGF